MGITTSFRLMQRGFFLSICGNKNWICDVRNLISALPSGPGDGLRQGSIPHWGLVNGTQASDVNAGQMIPKRNGEKSKRVK